MISSKFNTNGKQYIPLTAEEEKIGEIIVKSAFRVHQNLGPGLLEKIYESCFIYELKKKNLSVESQIEIPIVYDGIKLQDKLRIDILVNDLVVCELKAVNEWNSVYEAQILSYLKLTNKRLGYLINFNVPLIKKGIKRFIK